MANSLKRVALLAVPTFVAGCTAHFQAAAPEPVVTANAEVAPGEPAPAAPEAPAPPAAQADADVEPVTDGDPEEVTATTEPPDPVYEEQTAAPGPGFVWIGGYWGWNGTDWDWHWGRWERAPAGRVYVEPYYERVGGRVVYVRGYWGAPGAPRRSYGGEQIRFAAPARPANYHRGEHVVVEHRAGPLPGRRPGNAYVRATGPVRPLPRQTVPQRRVAVAHEAPAPREGREGPGREAPGRDMNRGEPARGEPGRDMNRGEPGREVRHDAPGPGREPPGRQGPAHEASPAREPPREAAHGGPARAPAPHAQPRRAPPPQKKK